ncbi:DUF1992 domain-containing protein [Microbacterium sp. NPDC055910]|uniref:DnaJ family domain-containing protein n=1 Tax=Microbacterium sp. NPDC055910 TaxID=3345659 RepID=UPI0035E064DA
MSEDPRLTAARYRQERDAAEPPEPAASDEVPRSPTGSSTLDRAAYVETAIQQAIRRGDFDNLPGAGKPIRGLGAHHDADWWIRRKIEHEQLTGLGPPALSLRVEHAEFAQRIDALANEHDAREYVEDFNRRVVEARRQLLGGPPVVTPTRDVDAELRAWRERRTTAEPEPDAAPPPRRRRRRR